MERKKEGFDNSKSNPQIGNRKATRKRYAKFRLYYMIFFLLFAAISFYLATTKFFLIEAVDEYEADMIVANLKCEGVFAFKRYKGSDSYNKVFLGRTILGVDIFVGESDYEEALNIIKY
ncbi:MAG: hypothetical protein RR064_06370 [Oscillospiraceae bacterium]